MGRHGVFMEDASFTDGGGPPRQKTITVIVLEDEFSGALAYALQSALHEPAKVRVVRVGRARERDRDLGLPLPIRAVTAEAAAALVRQAAGGDVMVVESRGQLAEASESLLDDLRHQASCLVVEVDGDGLVMRASGPEGWTYSALGSTGGVDGEPDLEPGTLPAGASPGPMTAGAVDRPLTLAHADGPRRRRP